MTSESYAMLAHYDENLSLKVSCDASPIGLGDILSHIVDSEEKPVNLLHLEHYQKQKLTVHNLERKERKSILLARNSTSICLVRILCYTQITSP